jgi:hypothetical protein
MIGEYQLTSDMIENERHVWKQNMGGHYLFSLKSLDKDIWVVGTTVGKVCA